VVFVLLPTAGREKREEIERFPRALFWDLLGVRTKAMTIHNEDYPELSRFPVPDEEHLSGRDVPEFTRAFARIVKGELLNLARQNL
jgi:hypothetical protein